MELNKNMMQKTVLALVLLAVAALSAFVVSERVSAPEYHKASMEALEEKKITVMEMTAAVAASSIAVPFRGTPRLPWRTRSQSLGAI